MMPGSRLELRSPLRIAFAYLLGPVCGLTVWLVILVVVPPNAPGLIDVFFGLWVLTIALGLPVCLMVEIVVVTPMLAMFQFFRWPWFNGWAAAAVGFLLSAPSWYFLSSLFPEDDGDPSQQAAQVNGFWTIAGWTHVATLSAWWGVIGLVAALVFRLIAVRRVPLQRMD
jgi:hypothetical protein